MNETRGVGLNPLEAAPYLQVHVLNGRIQELERQIKELTPVKDNRPHQSFMAGRTCADYLFNRPRVVFQKFNEIPPTVEVFPGDIDFRCQPFSEAEFLNGFVKRTGERFESYSINRNTSYVSPVETKSKDD